MRNNGSSDIPGYVFPQYEELLLLKGNLVPRLLSTLPVPSRCERTLVLSGHMTHVRLPYEVGVGRSNF